MCQNISWATQKTFVTHIEAKSRTEIWLIVFGIFQSFWDINCRRYSNYWFLTNKPVAIQKYWFTAKSWANFRAYDENWAYVFFYHNKAILWPMSMKICMEYRNAIIYWLCIKIIVKVLIYWLVFTGKWAWPRSGRLWVFGLKTRQ